MPNGYSPGSEPSAEADRRYFQHRAETEIALAQRATHPGAVRSHYLLAGFYLDLIHGDAPPAPAARSEPPQPAGVPEASWAAE
jgi:hypothetical protein